MGEGLLIAIAGPGPLNDPLSILPADFNRSICTEGVDDDDLIAPAQALEAIPNIFLFVETNHDG